MKNLYKHGLDYDRTIEFVKNNLANASSLSSELLRFVDFNSGVFFTLLPTGSDLEKLYEFKNGIVLPQNPMIVTEVDGKKSYHQETPNIENELSHFIFHELEKNNKLSCVFDDVMSDLNDFSLNEFYKEKHIYLHENEVLYVIQDINKNQQWILKCMRYSFSFWHSVGILTEVDCFKDDINILSLEDIQTICKETKMMLISAYDGEAYVLWEKINDFGQ